MRFQCDLNDRLAGRSFAWTTLLSAVLTSNAHMSVELSKCRIGDCKCEPECGKHAYVIARVGCRAVGVERRNCHLVN